MSKKLSRSVNSERKLRFTDNRRLPEAVDEFVPLIYHPFGEKVHTFSLNELELNLPTAQSATIQAKFQSAKDLSQQDSYYEYNRYNDADDGANVWDEYWFPSESESSDLSQSAASFMSWTDEVEVETTRKLQQFYDALESFLYDEAPPPENAGPALIEECLLWKSKFPHIRVVGKAILPPPDFRVSSSMTITEEVIAIDDSDSDDETVQGSPKPSFLELDDATDRFVYDDVTMGTQCEGDRSALRGKVQDSVLEDLFSFVTAKMEESRVGTPSRERSSNLERTAIRERTSNWERNSSRERGFRQDDASSQLDHRNAGVERSVTATSVKSNVRLTPRVANSSSSSRLVVQAPVNVHFEPVETRAYHSAALRVQSKGTPARRLHSFGGHEVKLGNIPSRQDVILRELRESQLRLSGKSTGNGTGDGSIQVKPRSKTWSGGRHIVLPPLETRTRDKDKVKSLPRSVSPLRIEVNGTKLTRAEPKEVSLKKYTLLGGTHSTASTDGRKIGRPSPNL